jgi:hypothetical protein
MQSILESILKITIFKSQITKRKKIEERSIDQGVAVSSQAVGHNHVKEDPGQ